MATATLTLGQSGYFAQHARSLPLRKVANHWPVKEYHAGKLMADYRDVLECGHTVLHEMGGRAEKRRCYVCGPEGK